ncbi:MAG: hypothetical protein JRN06_13070 [Nitrososphaerota archaeon]|nr:hypothetical protein [Nitrososphaerota archaeon]
MLTRSEARSTVIILPLKAFIAAKLGSRLLLGKLMLVEPDVIPATEIVGKVGTWVAIIRADSRR